MKKLDIELTPELAEMLQELADARRQTIEETIHDALKEGVKVYAGKD